MQAGRKAMLASRKRIVPTLEQTTILHGPARVREASQPSTENTLEAYNWSGYVDINGATRFSSSSFAALAAELVVPTAREAFGVCSGDADYGASWVGMDGAASNDVAQAGTEFDQPA